MQTDPAAESFSSRTAQLMKTPTPKRTPQLTAQQQIHLSKAQAKSTLLLRQAATHSQLQLGTQMTFLTSSLSGRALTTDTVVADLADNKVDGINFINFGVGGGEASEKYDKLFKTATTSTFTSARLTGLSSTSTMMRRHLLSASSVSATAISLTSTSTQMRSVRIPTAFVRAFHGRLQQADSTTELTSLRSYLGATTPEEMQEQIGDWDKFVAAAKTVSEKSSGKTALADTLGGMWQAYACGRTTPWVVDNKLQIDDFCKNFADTAKELWDCGGITKNSQWSDEWTAAGTNDSCMGYFVSTWGFGGFFLDAAGGEGGATYGKWAVCEGPQPFYWGGTWIVVNPKTDNGEEARDFIISATSDEDQMSAYATSKPEYVNNSKVMDSLISSDTVFNEKITNNMGGQNFYAALADNAKTINFNGLITEYDATVKTDFIDAVKTNYLEGGASWDDTVEAFKDLVSEDITSLDWDE